MKALKPQRLGVLHRVVEHQRRYTLVVTVFVYTPLDNGRALLPDQSMWLELGEILPWGVLDEGYPKPRGEVLVTGSAFAPSGGRVGAVMTGLELRRDQKVLVKKKLAVFGVRHWGGMGATDPVPFERMPIDYAHAFGGAGFTLNPVGKGVSAVPSEHGAVHPLPNVEDPKALVVTRGDKPNPAGFGPYPLDWPQRFSLVGKRYDQEWLKTRFPGPAEDFDAHFYNASPGDQRIDGFFRGDEQFVLEGMHPTRARLAGALTPLRVRAFVTQRLNYADDESAPDEVFKAIDTRLDTLHFFPDRERLVSVYRGTLEIADDQADDIVHLMIAAEDPGHERPLSHYREVLARRLDKDVGALETLNDTGLMPPTDKGWSARIDPGDVGEKVRVENLKLANSERGRKKGVEEARAALLSAGMDPGDAFDHPDLPPLPDDPYDIEAVLALEQAVMKLGEGFEAQLEDAKSGDKALKEQARAAFEEAGFDYDKEMEEARAASDEAMSYSAAAHLAMLQDLTRMAREAGAPNEELERDLADPRYRSMLEELEERVKETMRRSAHLMPAPTTKSGDEGQTLRVVVQAAKDGGESLRGRRLKGANLAAMDLRGLDLSGAILVGADLSHADLSGACLADAVLAHANLTSTNLSDADLSRANIGSTLLKDTNLSQALLEETVFMRSTFDGTLFVGARMKSPDFIEATFEGADFSYAKGETPMFIQADLRRVIFTGVQLVLARFLEVDVRGVDFTGAELQKAQFSCATGDGARFAGADLENAFFVYKASFTACDFSGANLKKANFNGTPLRGGQFAGAALSGASVVKCDLREANLYRIVGRQLLAMRANLRQADMRGADLLGAIFQKADLRGTNLMGANLSRADLSLIRRDRGTNMSDALLEDTRLVPEYTAPRAPRRARL